jgi:hypothetical protein
MPTGTSKGTIACNHYHGISISNLAVLVDAAFNVNISKYSYVIACSHITFLDAITCSYSISRTSG